MNRVFALRSGNSVTININGAYRNLALETEEEAIDLFKRALATKQDPSDENVKSLEDFIDPTHRVEESGILERDRCGNYFLKGYNMPMPLALVRKIQEYAKEGYPLKALENFWKLCMLNPDDKARQDLFSFADQFHFPITESGYFIAYKSVAGINMKHKEYAMFITREYISMKSAMKQKPVDFIVVRLGEPGEESYQLVKSEELGDWINEMAALDEEGKLENVHTWMKENRKADYYKLEPYMTAEELTDYAKQNGYEEPDLLAKWKDESKYVAMGTLQDLFDALNSLFDNEAKQFTDWHTRKMTIKLGEPVKMERDKCNSDPNQICSSGLHVGAPAYVTDFNRHTDQFVLAVLVNPANVVAVPYDYSFQKMRCCEYYPYAICEITDQGYLKELETPYFEANYCGYEAEMLEEQLKTYQKTLNDTELSAEEAAEIQDKINLIGNRLFLVGDAKVETPENF